MATATAAAKKTKAQLETELPSIETEQVQGYSDAWIVETITNTFVADADTREAVEKLTDLETTLARLQAEYDQLQSAVNNDPEELAERVLSGDELGDREQLFAKRQALAQRIEAFKLAITKQQVVCNNCRHLASGAVVAAIEPAFCERIEKFCKAIRDFEAARVELTSFRDIAFNAGVVQGPIHFPDLATSHRYSIGLLTIAHNFNLREINTERGQTNK